jgi:hypothetical protein
MRTHTVSTLICAAALSVAGCTVKDIDQPALAGPSTLAHSIQMTADRDTLTQNGVDFVDIRVTSIGPSGQSESIPLRAQIYVDGIPQDFGLLSTKTPITPTTIRYTAPAGSTLATQTATKVTIGVVPTSSGDFRGEVGRQIDLMLLPQGIILPTNPNLVASFTQTPTAPKAFEVTSFDASSSTNNGTACLTLCSYSWDFGDGGTATGITTTHAFPNIGTNNVTLTVTDSRGAQATKTVAVAVAAPTPPTVSFEITPTTVGVNQDAFFTAVASTAAAGRKIVSYEWQFGDGSTGSGVTTSHRYSTQGSFIITMKATDDVGAVATVTKTLTVSEGLPTLTLSVLPSAPKPNQTVTINVTAVPFGASTIVSYRYNWGDSSPEESGQSPTQSHVYGAVGNYVITVTVTDSLGRSRVATTAVTVANTP